MRFSFDESVRRLDGGKVLIGGSPITTMRLSAAGSDALDRLVSAGVTGLTGPERALARRLTDAGMLVPHPAVAPGTTGADLTVVIPVRDGADGLDATLGSIERARVRPGRVIVVDDASDDAGAVARVAARHGAHLIVRAENGGPAVARNDGLAGVATPLVAFVDADVEVDPAWLDVALAFLDEAAVAMVAPRVLPVVGGGRLDRYEQARSSLDMGRRPGPVRRRSRIAYVPSAALVGRTDVVRVVGGFDPDLRFGEDVDLVWRLDDAGHRVWFCGDESVVRHRVRPRWSGWLRQRFDYGTSAAPLEQRHPGALAPLGVSRWSVGVWGLVTIGHPVAGAAVVVGTTVAQGRKLGAFEHPMREAARLVVLGNLGAGESIARALVRPWFPITLAAASVSRRTRRVALTAAVGPALLEWRRRRPPLDPVSWVAISLVDDLAYSAGVWVGCGRAGRWGALRPAVT